MELFTQCEGLVITARGGINHQRNLFRRGTALYVQHGSGFVRLRTAGDTTVPKLRWITLYTTQAVAVEGLGFLVLHDGKDTKQRLETANVFIAA